jgi:two-component system, response regulator PdtaR
MKQRKSLIVFVEEEPATRAIVEAALEDANFVVLSAGNAEDAISTLERADGYVSAVFTNVNLPGPMDGLDLAHYVSRRWPSIGLLVTSGHVPNRPVAGQGRFLSKPYDLGHVVHEVREAVSHVG